MAPVLAFHPNVPMIQNRKPKELPARHAELVVRHDLNRGDDEAAGSAR